MKLDEFAFVNQQLAGMLRSGIPLEGALRQLCETMARGRLQTELLALESDLAKGTPLRVAVDARQLPEFYKQMLRVGVESNDLPSLLILLADHYQRLHFTWMRLKGLMLYPLIVLLASFAVSLMVALMFTRFSIDNSGLLAEMLPVNQTPGMPRALQVALGLWTPVALLGSLCLAVLAMLAVPRWRRWLRGRFPGFKEAGLSHLASLGLAKAGGRYVVPPSKGFGTAIGFAELKRSS